MEKKTTKKELSKKQRECCSGGQSKKFLKLCMFVIHGSTGEKEREEW